MSDVKVIRYLLANNAPLIAVVPAAKIMAGMIPQGTALPAIAVSHVSGVWRQEISQQSRQCRARVQVTVMAATYPQQKQIIGLIRTAIPRTRGTINSVNVESILREPDGPDFRDDEIGSFMQTQDYFVTFDE
ncbi:MAG: DUF3168 domain-containing protein [Hyphomicrobium sp.]|jgi:hypothetical protein